MADTVVDRSEQSGKAKKHTPALPPYTDLYSIDSLLTEEERMVRDTVREFVRERVLPIIGEHFEAGTFPRELIPRSRRLGLLGMHLEGYGCAGLSAVSYGLACQELEYGDSGLRSFVSVQGSLAMFPIWAYGSEEQKQRWLPKMAQGEVIGCFGLTEPDFGSNPSGMLTTARQGWRQLHPQRHQDVDHQWRRRRSRRRLGQAGGRAFAASSSSGARRASRPAMSTTSSRCAPLSPQNCTSRSAASPRRTCCPMCAGLRGPLSLPGRGALRHRLGRERRGAGLLRGGAGLRQDRACSSTAPSAASS